MRIDGATFNIITNGFHAVAQEMEEKLVRSAYSVIIREARDCSTSLLDPKGRVIAQAQFCPIQMKSFGMVFEAFAERYDLSHIRRQEGFITNEPYSGGQHLTSSSIGTILSISPALTIRKAYPSSIGCRG